MTDDTDDQGRRPQQGFKPYFDWRHYLFGYNLAAATLQLLLGTGVACTIFAVLWTCFAE